MHAIALITFLVGVASGFALHNSLHRAKQKPKAKQTKQVK